MNATEELDNPERHNLITQLSETLNLPTVDSGTWACLWFADMQKLHAMVDSAKGPGADGVRAMLTGSANAAMLKAWRPCKDEFDDWLSDPTKMEFMHQLEVSEIYPYSFVETPEEEQNQQTLWSGLSNFWTSEHITSWKTAIEQSEDTCANMITFIRKITYLWGKARFALKPSPPSDDRRQLDLQFLWLSAGKFSRRVSVVSRPVLPNNLDAGPGNVKLFRDEQRICSGRVFDVTTHDPEKLPLPSVELMEMQWILHRATAVSGVVDLTGEEIERAFDRFYPLAVSNALNVPSEHSHMKSNE